VTGQTVQSWEQGSSRYSQREPEFQGQRDREMPGLIYGSEPLHGWDEVDAGLSPVLG